MKYWEFRQAQWKRYMFLVASLLQMDLLQEFYETTLEALKDAKNDRLWFKTNTKVHMIISLNTYRDR